MSVYVIHYKDGAKMMRPVLTRDEYIALRNSNKQVSLLASVRKGKTPLKMMLLQMNYSCLPNEDGSLKGSTRMSTTIGMDVDWTPSPLPHEGEEQIAARKEEWLKKVPELVLSKKEELGLLMLERSATKGFHLVFRRKPELTQEENLKWASDLLGVEYDKGAKDITRVFFTTSASKEDLIYLDDEVFEVEEVKEGAKREVKTVNGLEVKEEVKEDDTKSVEINERIRFIAQGVMKEKGLEESDFLSEGGRHTTVKIFLSGATQLLTKEEVNGVLQELMPKHFWVIE